MSTLSTTLLADLIRRKHDVLVQLCDVGRRQKEIVDAWRNDSPARNCWPPNKP